MRHWTRSFGLAVVLVVALVAGGALAAPNAVEEPAVESVFPEVTAAEDAPALPEAPVEESPTVAEEGVSGEEAAEELFLPYPVEEPPVISVNYDRIFEWLNLWLERHDLEGSQELIATWKALAEKWDEQPEEVWNELIGELGELGIGWVQEQLDLLQSFREEIRSGLAELREQTVELIRDHLQMEEAEQEAATPAAE